MDANAVRVKVYEWFIDRGRAPSPIELAAEMAVNQDQVEDALRSLADDDVFALVPGTSLIWLAHPFCALDAPFRVRSGDRSWEAICIWDALGVLALLDIDGRVSTRCPDCGEPLEITVRKGQIEAASGTVVHFGVPAARWYENVGFT